MKYKAQLITLITFLVLLLLFHNFIYLGSGNDPIIVTAECEKCNNEIADKYNEEQHHLAEINMLFQSTIRNCLGKKCFDSDGDNDRVGVLATPFSGSDVLQEIITLLTGNNNRLIFSTNVPAYGYGKNHGWSRIIRIIRSPVLQTLHILEKKIDSEKKVQIYDAQVK
jgi:hypothetical protein